MKRLPKNNVDRLVATLRGHLEEAISKMNHRADEHGIIAEQNYFRNVVAKHGSKVLGTVELHNGFPELKLSSKVKADLNRIRAQYEPRAIGRYYVPHNKYKDVDAALRNIELFELAMLMGKHDASEMYFTALNHIKGLK